MKTQLLVQDRVGRTLLAEVELEVVPRGTYVVDDVPYQLTGQPTFIINTFQKSDSGIYADDIPSHVLERVELMVEKMR